jgi:GNAT superfamily N-acetyltransferase
MYLHSPQLPRDVVVCLKCMLETLELNLAFGWDVHNHDISAVCDGGCAVKSALGRRWQLQLMRQAFMDRTRGFYISKAIDGQPGVNGTFQLQAMRAMRFLSQIPRLWYEPIRDVAGLRTELVLGKRLEEVGVSPHARPHIRLVLQLFQSAHRSDTGEIEFPRPGENPLALHSVVATGLSADGQSVEFANNWGRSWGDGGNGSVSFAYLDQYFSEAWTRWDARYGLSFFKPELHQIESNRDLRRIWMIENPIRKFKLRGTRAGDSWYVEYFYTYSPVDDCGVQGVQVRNGYGIRMGWAHLWYPRDSQITEIRELFVMPPFRRLGIGSYLEGFAVRRSQGTGATAIEATIHQADGGVLSNRGAVRGFLANRGYQIAWRNRTGPLSVGTGEKSVPEVIQVI